MALFITTSDLYSVGGSALKMRLRLGKSVTP